MFVEGTHQDEEAPQQPKERRNTDSNPQTPSEHNEYFIPQGVNHPINHCYTGIYRNCSPTPWFIALYYSSTTATFPEYSMAKW